MNFAFEDQTQPTPTPTPSPKPVHTFNVNMAFGETSVEVEWLQKCLQYLGMFPKNITPTGFYGSVTADAVLAFQVKFNISPTSPHNAGPLTREKLNTLFTN
jgi:peptidoglycan hydrolase-like protein with peptidoglycan-binding domain